MKHIIHTLSILICVVALVGCNDIIDSSQDIQHIEPNISADTFEIVGNITYKNIEGGFFAIDGDDGSKYDPINLPESFRKDGLKVKVTARLKKDSMSIRMYGTIIEVVNIAAQ